MPKSSEPIDAVRAAQAEKIADLQQRLSAAQADHAELLFPVAWRILDALKPDRDIAGMTEEQRIAAGVRYSFAGSSELVEDFRGWLVCYDADRRRGQDAAKTLELKATKPADRRKLIARTE